jgi:1,2-diacylglycerol 3-beta-galactosyltransferase
VVLRGGGGHYSTYKALSSTIEQQYPAWEIDVTFADTLGERLAQQNQSLDIYKLFGTTSDDFYDWILQHNWTWAYLLLIRLNKLLIRLNFAAGVKLLASDWRKQSPDLIVSVVPFFNRVVWESIQQVKPGTPVVTILTDFADCPPAYWIEPQTENYLICGTDKAAAQEKRLGIPSQRILKTSGLAINPKFYQPIDETSNLTAEAFRATERQRLGLEPDCLTGLVLFGANGSQVMVDIAQRLAAFGDKLQLIFLCGRNGAVAEALQHQTGQKKVVVGFTEDIPFYMHLADFFIGKPGNVSISEALVMQLPVIVEKNFTTLPQEQYLTEWIQQQQVGIVIPSFRQINRAVQQMLKPEVLASYRTNVKAIANRSVFEIPAILQQILASCPKTANDSVLEPKSCTKAIIL